MEELNAEISALSDIFSAREFEVIWGDECLAVSFPLPFRLELQFVITIIDSTMYDITVQIIESEVPLLDLVLKASCAAQLAAEEFLADRERGEHKHLYSAHQRAIDAFDKCISAEESVAQTSKAAEDNDSKCETPKIEHDASTEDNTVDGGDLPNSLPETTVIILDHINDNKKYYKCLSKWSQQLNLSCIVFAKSPSVAKGDRSRHVVLIIQSLDSNNEFLRKLKTENVDVNAAGKSCKERCSTTLLVSRQYEYLEADNTFQIVDCSATEAIKILHEKYCASEIGDSVSSFCNGKM